ncbi:MAG: xanthine dehydrogenase family protein molybdopterin-binding subunit [Deltaproteobacteria bacterium]|nr:MAG: xanthine dehydrogenase family protein molybdopterin-binding subunit [Deltaproteobacteria bacterium]TMB35595.1 MAG: xanthine dehydrogenase family protein molybdopterin-binding subunit [Deltaproteobacteria bacterium]
MTNLTRRALLQKSLLSGAGLFVAFHVPRKLGAVPQAAAKQLPDPNAFVRVAPDGSVTVLLAHSEMGQGIWTSLAMLVAEELDCDWSKIRVEHAPAAPVYAHPAFGMQMTGGSTSTSSEFDRYRQAGALARAMLVRAAAANWKMDAKKLRTENGFVLRGKEKLSYGELAVAAQGQTPPQSFKLKNRKDWKILGKPTRRLDSPEKVIGKAGFGIDVRFPGLRTALVARSPVFGGTVKSFDPAKARAVKGVEQVVQVPSGVAVVASNFWSAKLGRDALQVDWDLGPGASLDSAKLLEDYRAQAQTKGAVATEKGDADAALSGAAKKVIAEYDVPYLAHATMEPMNCAVKLEGDRCEIWTGTQFQTMDQMTAAKIAGIPQQNVSIHTQFLGGGFGRRATPSSDFVAEAVHVAKVAKVPVKVVWTREDDIQGGYYRPLFLHRIEAGLDSQGRPVGWRHSIVGQSILTGTPFEQFMVKNGIDATSVEGVVDSPYLEAIRDRRVVVHSPRLPVPVLWWRSVGNTHTAFAMESAIDELAWAAGRDPLEFRSMLLADKPRHLRALKAAAKKAGWGTPPSKGRARGLAVHESFGSIVAQVAEVSVDKDKEIHVHKVSCAVDCGTAINPLGIEAQVQGAMAFGLAAVLHSEVTLKAGRVEQSNFHDYLVLRMPEMPDVSVQVLESDAKMGGIGEPAAAPISAAVANAVYALTRQRLRSLPLRLA